MNASYFLMAAIDATLAGQIVNSFTVLFPIVFAWAIAKKARHRASRKTGRPPSPMHGRLIMVCSMSSGILLSAAVFWFLYRGGRQFVEVQGVAMIWVGLLGIIVQLGGIVAALYFWRGFGQYSDSNNEHAEEIARTYAAQRLVHQEQLLISERQLEIERLLQARLGLCMKCAHPKGAKEA